MLNLLSQIIVSLLAIEAGLTGAYIVYLHSARSNIDQQIQIEGSNIVTLLRRQPNIPPPQNAQIPEMFRSAFFYFNDCEILIKNYKVKYPDMSELEILRQISLTLWHLAAFSPIEGDTARVEAEENLRTPPSANAKKTYSGRIAVWIIRKHIDYFAFTQPGDHEYSIANKDHMTSPTKKNLFPYGPLGVEEWSSEFTKAVNHLEFLLSRKNVFVSNLAEWLHDSKPGYNITQFQQWFDEAIGGLRQLESANMKVQNLLKFKSSYTLQSRLPHLNSMLLCMVLTFALGIITPLLVLAFRPENSTPSVPWVINIGIVFLSILSFFFSAYYFAQDITANPEKLSQVRQLAALTDQLENDLKNEYSEYRIDIASGILSKGPMSYDLKSALKEYIADAEASKTETKILLSAIEKDIGKSSFMAKLSIDDSTFKSLTKQAGSQWQSLNAIELLDQEKRHHFLEPIIKSETANKIVFEYFSAITGSQKIMCIVIPNDAIVHRRLSEEVERIFNKLSQDSEVKACLRTRQKFKTSVKNVLSYLRTAFPEQ